MVNMEKMDSLIQPFINNKQIPGMAIAIFDNDKFQCHGYGYSDVKHKFPVDELTLFEIGSMSKAFTALGIFLLEHQQRLHLSDPVEQYIPWFQPFYKVDGRRVSTKITISQLLYHTSGIPFHTLFDIPIDNTDHALQDTIWQIRNIKLVYKNGTRYEYASNNYNVLAYIIERITNQSFEEFMKKIILQPLQLFHTHMSRSDAEQNGNMALGYKQCFFVPRPYTAPVFRGNVAGGYVISCIHDMGRWLRIQMGKEDVDEVFKNIIQKSHNGMQNLDENPGYKLGAGWHVNQDTGVIQYMGSNPNFSSKIIFNASRQWGVCILSNVNSSAAYYLAENILKCNKPQLLKPYRSNTFIRTDTVFSLLSLCNALSLIMLSLCLLFRGQFNIYDYKWVFIAGLFIWICAAIWLPYVLKKTLKWRAIVTWASFAIPLSCILGLGSMLLGCLISIFN